jgi:hypothetical protein
MVQGGHFLLQFDVLLSGVLFQFHLFVKHCLFVAQVAHRVDETL